MRQHALVPSLVLAVCLVSASELHALANRVFVSQRSGSDANTCDNILTPCQTLQGAVNQTAAGGEVIVLDSGGYGKVLITQSIKVEAPPGIVAFVHPTGASPAISISAGPADVVVLRGLVLNVGSSDGIQVSTVGELHVENCVIDGFPNGIEILGTGKLAVLDTIVRHCSASAIEINPTGTAIATIERCRLENSHTGLDVANNGNGNFAKASIKDSVTSQNSQGMRVRGFSNGVAELNIENCLSANNSDSGIDSFANGGTSIVRVSNTTVTDNVNIGLDVFTIFGGTAELVTRGNNTVEGNTVNGSFTGTFTAK